MVIMQLLVLLLYCGVLNGASPSTWDCQQAQAASTEYYFAYGSNLNPWFMRERLKDGDWLPDGWHKSGHFSGPELQVLGLYTLQDYEFGYNLWVGNETTGNVVPKTGSRVYGMLYKISELQLNELDRTEDVPRDYMRVALKVKQAAASVWQNAPSKVDAWVYVGNAELVTAAIDPDPEYVAFVTDAAIEQKLPQDYIETYLKMDLFSAVTSNLKGNLED